MIPSFDALVQDFFCRRLIEQQGVSPRTVEAYRDTFRLLLAYLPQHLGKPVPALGLTDLDAPAVLAFLDHLETTRGNGPRTRNARLATLRSFVQYAASRDPTAWPLARRVLAIPAKRYSKPLLGYLTREEMQAILDAPDAATWAGQRDRVLLAVMYNTGARVSEAVGLRRGDLTDTSARSLRIRGKGRKERVVPLWKQTAKALAHWSKQLDDKPDTPLFPNARGQPLSRSGFEDRLALAVDRAVEKCAGLKGKSVTPHTIRHTTAMHLLQSGVDVTVIALWLGHESPETTHQYVEADLRMKEEVLAKARGLSPEPTVYRPKGKLLAFLDSL
ncbi:site-specific integrase [Singulisphaera acidiphila]|uniref:Site-specific recombinase XerD n=1 Tax=Singulisphaera acidiphila (strain ATCC BAA-1392 / DSM 18658 / VKM B-2454 / MOB10) TaxID=886293 RepID=L0DAV1_SINAD|nr:site-specific integrase [Singulisphaera acidiphila]AGA26504.1 site-specific recombinase XerD [Singulisphaera acidiphila DSM 18658]